MSGFVKNNDELPEGWGWTTLGKISDVVAGNPAPQGVEYFIDGKHPFLRVQDMGRLGNNSHVYKTHDYINNKAIQSLRLFPKGSVLFTKSGASTLLNQRAILGRDMYVVSHIAAIIPYKGILSEWLYYWLKTVDFNKLAHATTLPSLPLSKAKNIHVPVAPPNVQKLIVAEIEKQFSRLDEAVAALKRIKANLKRYKASVLKAAVEGKLTEQWRKEHPDVEPADKLLKRILVERKKKWEETYPKKKYKEPAAPDTSSLPELPKGWVWARLDSVAEIKGGITVDKKRVIPRSRNIAYLRVANVQRGYLDLSEIKQIQASVADIEALRLRHGDILFNEGGDRDKLGRGWIWEDQIPECIHQNHVFRARLFLPTMSSKLISWWGNTFGKNYFLREGKQTTNLASVNLTKLSAFPVPLPSLIEQQLITEEIERRLSVTEEIEVEIETNLKRAERLRQSILKKAFSGRLVQQSRL